MIKLSCILRLRRRINYPLPKTDSKKLLGIPKIKPEDVPEAIWIDEKEQKDETIRKTRGNTETQEKIPWE